MLTEAWAFLWDAAVVRRETDLFPAAPYIDAFEQERDDDARARLQEAMWIVLRDGAENEQAIAATFFVKTEMPSSLADQAAQLYVARGLGADSALAVLLAGQTRLSTSARDALRDQFHRQPMRHAAFAYSTIVDARDSADWKALETIAQQTDDPATLAAAFNGAFARERGNDLGSVLSQRPKELLKAAAPQTFAEDEFLAAAGVKP
ncbi:MAG TPA: hypothetical protein VGL86_24640 [Polyangia bacterium]|jgi:hypothetical protein